MKAINKAEEESLDRRSDRSSIYIYGDVNLKDPKDIEAIKQYRLYHTDGKAMVHNNFNYENGTFALTDVFNGKEMEKRVQWGPSIDPIEWFKYNHCLLGKPEKIVVYQENGQSRRRF